MIAKYNELADEIKLTAMVVDELPKKGIVGCIYFKKTLPDGYEAYIYFKKYRLSFIDWLFRRTHEWVNIGYEDEADHDWAIIKTIDEEERTNERIGQTGSISQR